MSKRTDAEWVRSLKAKDAAAIQDLWEQLYVWGSSMAQGKSAEPDIGSDAAIAAHQRILERGILQYKFGCPFLIYCRIILNNELRRQLRQQPPLTEPLSEHNDPIAANSLPETLPEIVRSILQPCWDKLKEQQRNVLGRLYLKSEKPQEIADELSITRHYVNVIANRGRNKLRVCLELRGYQGIDDIL